MKADELQQRAAVGEIPASGEVTPTQNFTGLGGSSRRRNDRRQRPTTFWGSLFGPRRRVGGRRGGEGQNTYVDRYRKNDVLLLAAIFGLNIADALFTLIWVKRGGSEANPVMDWFLQQGDWVFLGQKCLVVGLWLVILVIHKNFQMARVGLWCLLVLYGSIFLYHIFLQAAGVPVSLPPAH